MNGSAGDSAMARLLTFLDHLEVRKLSYRLEHIRDSMMVSVAVPGERWEIEAFDDAHVEIERFRSTGEIEDSEALNRLLTEYAD